jgi:cell wall-associated NlpC family hydrolase
MIGTPVVYQGKVPGAGLDCVGMVIATYAFCGKEIQPLEDYKTTKIEDARKIADKYLICQESIDPLPCTFLLFGLSHGPHFAFYDGDRLIHSGKVKISYGTFGKHYRDRLSGVYKIDGVNYG